MQTLTAPKLDEISFSQNWNKKLNCKYFTTLRLPAAKYYPGNMVKVIIKNEYIYNAAILTVKKIWLRDLDDYTAYLDTGYSAKQTIELLTKMYPSYDFNTKPLYVILCRQMDWENGGWV